MTTLDQWWKLKERKTKHILTKGKGWSDFWFKKQGKCEQMTKEESGACMQPHVRDGMVYFGKLTQGRDK